MISLFELFRIHSPFNIRKFTGKPRSSLWREMVVLADILKSYEFRFRDPPAVLGQLDNFFCILLGNAAVSLTGNPLVCCFQKCSVVADTLNRLVITLFSLFELFRIHSPFNIRKFTGKPRSSLWREMVVLADILKSYEFRFRDPPAVLGQLDNFFCILLGNAAVSLTGNPLVCCFQKCSVVADTLNRLVITLCHISPLFYL